MQAAEPRLQSKLLVWLLAPLLALLALDTAVTYWTSVNFSNLAYDRALHEIAREVVLHVKPNDSGPKLELSPAAERLLLVDQDDRVAYKVWGGSGTPIGGDPRIARPSRPLPTGGEPLFYDDVLDGEKVRMVAAWMPFEGAGGAAPVLVQVAETLNKRQRLAWEILANVVVPQLLLIMLATAIVYIGISRGLGPLRRLQRAVSDRSHLDLTPIDLHGVPGEVRPLVQEVNHLMQRLAKTLDFQNRFIADAAHQLKTPVAGLKAQIEMGLRETDPDQMRHSLAQVYVGADRLSRLVRQLLSLARNEPGATESVSMQALDLNAFALDLSMEWVPQAIKAGIDLGFDGGAPVMID
ncbi:MAG: sensor histidine kinase N-terminal domain-containing protein, partial [Ramlibacter sp.]|nr:sensor histidine kinase N-terminal domain-containing protein [Ramlibacter sp.]